MKILIVYATVEGQTAKIARFADRRLSAAGHDCTLFDACLPTAALSLDGFDGVILAAPVHERRHPKEFEVLLAGLREELSARRTLLLSVSLSAAFPEGLEEAADYVTEMKMRTGFAPDAECLVAGAIRGSRYDYFARQVVHHVVLRGRDVDPADDEHEFTDWGALAVALDAFAEARALA